MSDIEVVSVSPAEASASRPPLPRPTGCSPSTDVNPTK